MLKTEEDFMSLFVIEDDIPKIMDLFKAVYPNRDCPRREYWQWLFDNPLGYTPLGLWEYGKIISYSAAIHLKNKVILTSSMTHPNYRGSGNFSKVAKEMFYMLKRMRVSYLYLVSNETIHNTWSRLGLTSVNITEYQRKPYVVINRVAPFRTFKYPTPWLEWRFGEHPSKGYYLYEFNDNYCIMNKYENNAQIVWFKYWSKGVFRIAHAFARANYCDLITVWSRKVPKGFTPVELTKSWYMYKKLKRFTRVPKSIMMGEVDIF